MRKAPSFQERVYFRLQKWADAGWSGSVVFLWGFLQGCIVPGFVDLFFLPLAVARPERAYRLAVPAIAGTVVGSTLLYYVGSEALYVVQGTLGSLLGMTESRFAEVRSTLAKYGGLAVLASTMSPLSTKLTSLASGAAGVPFAEWLAYLAAGRTIRAFGIAWIVRNKGADWLRDVLGIQLPNTSKSSKS